MYFFPNTKNNYAKSRSGEANHTSGGKFFWHASKERNKQNRSHPMCHVSVSTRSLIGRVGDKQENEEKKKRIRKQSKLMKKNKKKKK